MCKSSSQNNLSYEANMLSSDTNNTVPNMHEVFRFYDDNVHLNKTLIHVCVDLKSVKAAKLVIERIIEGVGKYQDALDDYLSRDNIETDVPKITILKEYLNRQDMYGVAPIHLAAHHGDIKMVKLLCANECDPYAKTEDGLSIIHSAAEGDAVNIIYYLTTKYQMDIDEKDVRGSTSLHWAVYEGNEIATTYLISWGADINAQDSDGNTPLHLSISHAEREQNTRLTKILLLKGADRDITNNKGLTPAEMVSDGDMKDELSE